MRFLFVIYSMLLTGCVTTGEFTKSQPVNVTDQNCNFEQLTTPRYKLSLNSINNVNKVFSANNNVSYLDQTEGSLFKYLFSDTGIKPTNRSLPIYPYNNRTSYALRSINIKDVELDGKMVRIDHRYAPEFITRECILYYLQVKPRSADEFLSILEPVDKHEFNESDLIVIYGNAAQIIPATISSAYDEFEKVIKYKTNMFGGVLIRGAREKNEEVPIFNQIYIVAKFYDNWGHIRIAKDKFGNTFDVTRINTDADCSEYNTCELTEQVGITVTTEYLKEHSTGLELSLRGTRTYDVKVPSTMIKKYLEF